MHTKLVGEPIPGMWYVCEGWKASGGKRTPEKIAAQLAHNVPGLTGKLAFGPYKTKTEAEAALLEITGITEPCVWQAPTQP